MRYIASVVSLIILVAIIFFWSGGSFLVSESIYITVEKVESDEHGVLNERRLFKQSCQYFNGLKTWEKVQTLPQVQDVEEVLGCKFFELT